MIDNNIVPVSTSLGQSGFVLDNWDGLPPGRPQAVSLRGFEFTRGNSNINIVYTTGFTINNEAQTVPASGNYTIAVNAPYGSFGRDVIVKYANGNILNNVSNNPSAGQYTVNNGIYGFAAADAGANLLISYSYIPADIEHACIEIVGERYRYKNHIGEVSKTLGGQGSVSFSQKDMPDFVRTLLQPYRRVVAV